MTRPELHRLEAELDRQREFWCCVRDIACGFVVTAGIVAIVWWNLDETGIIQLLTP